VIDARRRAASEQAGSLLHQEPDRGHDGGDPEKRRACSTGACPHGFIMVVIASNARPTTLDGRHLTAL
jgi:hypothetical protein